MLRCSLSGVMQTVMSDKCLYICGVTHGSALLLRLLRGVMLRNNFSALVMLLIWS